MVVKKGIFRSSFLSRGAHVFSARRGLHWPGGPNFEDKNTRTETEQKGQGRLFPVKGGSVFFTGKEILKIKLFHVKQTLHGKQDRFT